MKIAVIGPGALGCFLAAALSREKKSAQQANEVWLLDKSPERVLKLNKQGIIVEGLWGNWKAKIKATADTSQIGKADLVIIAVKAFDTKDAAQKAKQLIKQDSILMTLQNGIGNIEIISEVIESANIIGGITNLGCTLLDIGSVRLAGTGETIVGRLDGNIPVEMRYIRQAFTKACLDIKFSRDIKGILWSKLIINVGINALTAITGLPNGRLPEFEGTKRILREAVTEAIKVAKRKRIKLLYDDPLAKVESVCESTAQNISSMLQDVLRKKKTEIDFINGVIVRQGQELGIAVPVNTFLSELVKTIEKSYKLSLR